MNLLSMGGFPGRGKRDKGVQQATPFVVNELTPMVANHHFKLSCFRKQTMSLHPTKHYRIGQ